MLRKQADSLYNERDLKREAANKAIAKAGRNLSEHVVQLLQALEDIS